MEEPRVTGGDAPPIVKISLSAGAFAPEYSSEGAAGADLRAFLSEDLAIAPGGRKAVPTGIFMEIPPGWEAQVRPRSGLALKSGIGCLNSPGTIDSDYRGEVKVILVNHSDSAYTVKNGDRIAQLVLSRTWRAHFAQAETLSATERGEGGFGSTGT
jgi:dUTP pyrophosphatase